MHGTELSWQLAVLSTLRIQQVERIRIDPRPLDHSMTLAAVVPAPAAVDRCLPPAPPGCSKPAERRYCLLAIDRRDRRTNGQDGQIPYRYTDL